MTQHCEHGYETQKACPFCRRIAAVIAAKEQIARDEAITPYAGTSGWSGTSTSRDRAVTQDRDGITSQRQRYVLKTLEENGPNGLTWRELADDLAIHHGGASGVLSVLHKTGLIERLAQTRNRMKIYVLPEYVDGRPIEPHGRQPKPCSNCGHVEEA